MRRMACLLVVLALLAAGAAAAAESAAPDTSGLPELTPEELFLRASSAALQFEHLRAPSRRLLIKDHEESLPYLVTRLDTDDARERHALEDILVKIGEPAVASLRVAILSEYEREGTTRGARLAAGVLGRIGDAEALTELVAGVGHEDWKVRASVASALGRLGIVEAVDPLLESLGDRNESVRKGAAVALGRLAGSDVEPSSTRRVADALVSSLDDRYYSVRMSAADALTKIGGTEILGLLTEAAGTEGSPSSLLAIRALGEIGDRSSLPDLARLLDSDDWATRAFAAEAIGRIAPDRRTRKRLGKTLSTEDHPFVIARAAEALAPADQEH